MKNQDLSLKASTKRSVELIKKYYIYVIVFVVGVMLASGGNSQLTKDLEKSENTLATTTTQLEEVTNKYNSQVEEVNELKKENEAFKAEKEVEAKKVEDAKVNRTTISLVQDEIITITAEQEGNYLVQSVNSADFATSILTINGSSIGFGKKVSLKEGDQVMVYNGSGDSIDLVPTN